MKAYQINIYGLTNTIHHFEYEIGKDFFIQFGSDMLSDGVFNVSVDLNKHETFLEADINIKGFAKLICDRSLEPFDFPIDKTRKIVFKYGDQDMELTDEIMMINRDATSLDIGQFIYEFIVLEVPMKRLHPKFQDEEDEDDDESEGRIIYSSLNDKKEDDGDDDESIDPRWEQLKKLK